jgi:hypothetical protein
MIQKDGNVKQWGGLGLRKTLQAPRGGLLETIYSLQEPLQEEEIFYGCFWYVGGEKRGRGGGGLVGKMKNAVKVRSSSSPSPFPSPHFSSSVFQCGDICIVSQPHQKKHRISGRMKAKWWCMLSFIAVYFFFKNTIEIFKIYILDYFIAFFFFGKLAEPPETYKSYPDFLKIRQNPSQWIQKNIKIPPNLYNLLVDLNMHNLNIDVEKHDLCLIMSNNVQGMKHWY